MVVPPSTVSYNPYRVDFAMTEALKDECFRIRHQVYCIEHHFEPPNAAGIETDVYDDRAVHFLVRHKPSNQFIGTARVILPAPKSSSAPLPPVFQLCREHAISLPQEITPDNCIEISRFAISKNLAKKANQTTSDAVFLRTNPLALKAGLSLIATIYQTMLAKKLPYCAVVMASALPKLLAWQGIHMTPIGPPIEYHGKRRIYHMSEQTFTAAVSRFPKDLHRLFNNRVVLPVNKRVYAWTIT